ncbi:MAG: formylmethanofuran dehydrogenase [Gammaproteobacteria bacterium]|nr:formylmethanofuran dehydrogenase [Gammaproteobacteria bacterium]
MPEIMLLIAGRTSDQGTSLNRGKLKEEYLQVTSTVEMNEDDMARLGLQAGDRIRLSNDTGETTVTCQPRKRTDLPAGMLFMAYGPSSSQLMASDTAGTGMPISKNFTVQIEKITGAA